MSELNLYHGTLTPHSMSPQSCNEEFFTHKREREREGGREREGEIEGGREEGDNLKIEQAKRSLS